MSAEHRPPTTTMRVLLLMWSVNYDRLFEATLRELLARGHSVHVAFETDKDGISGDTSLFESLRATHPGLTWSLVPRRRRRLLAWWRRQLRLTLDLLRYLEPPYAGADALRTRALLRAPRIVARACRSALGGSTVVRRGTRALLRRAEAALPPDPSATAFISDIAPDLVAATPLVMLGSLQSEYVRAARRLGVPTAFLVASWDNLTNKGLVHDVPDLTVVWNDEQRREAVDLHGIPARRVAVTGAHSYDHWFGRRPSRSREELCDELGLDPSRPLLLYACSSPFIAPNEVETVRRWLGLVRGSSDALLRDSSVVVRPHPANHQPWAGIGEPGRTVVWPEEGVKPTAEDAKRDYFDTIAHAAAVIGINTSTLVESAIAGRPTFTLLEPESRGSQEGTLHFHHLSALHIARTPEEHEQQLLEAARGGEVGEREHSFVETFLRPRGVDTPAAPLVVDELERLVDPAGGRRVLFALDHPGFLLHFDETIASLVARGDTVHLAFARPDKWPHGLDAIDRDHPGLVVHEQMPRRTRLPRLARGIRRLADYVHYLDPSLAGAVYAREKWRRLARFPGPLAALRRTDTLPRPVVGAILKLLSGAERALPEDSGISAFLEAIAPDALVVSPLVDARTDFTDYVRAARRLGIPSALCVASWDNLSSKGLVRVTPDRVVVWNETQRDEAARFHRIAPERVIVTGAQPYDRWFERAPSATPDAFADRHGLPRDRPVIVFAGSTKQGQDPGLEPRFVRSWIEALRSSGRAEVAEAAILVRPHPTNEEAWRSPGLDDLRAVSVWSRERGLPVTADDRAEYFDALHHAAGVVAINSTALIEATIVGTPAHTVALPEFRALQHDLLHYHYLLPENGGFLREARSLEEHAQLLADDIADPAAFAGQRASFVESFIRPLGVSEPATPRIVAAVERLADYR